MLSVYVLRCSDGSLYIGHTGDLDNRIGQHAAGKVKWTSTRLPIKLVHTEEFETRKEAIQRERELKTGYGRKWLKRKLQ